MGMKNIQMGRAPDCTHVAHLENILGVEALKVFFSSHWTKRFCFTKKKLRFVRTHKFWFFVVWSLVAQPPYRTIIQFWLQFESPQSHQRCIWKRKYNNFVTFSYSSFLIALQLVQYGQVYFSQVHLATQNTQVYPHSGVLKSQCK